MRERLRRIIARLRPQPEAAASACESVPSQTLSEVAATEPQVWDALLKDATAPSVLVATSTGGHQAVAPVECLMAAALTVRGADVHVLLCDGVLSACMECDITRYPDVPGFAASGPQADRCSDCFGAGLDTYRDAGIVVHRYSELLTGEERAGAHETALALPVDAIRDWELDGLKIGEHAYAGTLRFFARGDLGAEPMGEPVLRRYFEAALLTALATRRLARDVGITASVFHHGIYVPQGIVAEVLRAEKVHVVNWVVAYRKGCFIFSHDDTYHHTLMTEPVEVWEDMPWDEFREQAILEYLKSRWYGTEDWIWFHENPETGVDRIEEEVGIDFSRPTIGLLTNVVWDAQLHYPANAFPDMLNWLMRTIEYFRGRPDLQLLIRVHPAEVRGTLPTRQPAVEEIAAAFPQLPSNVYVIGPESGVSTYAAMERCNAVIIYGTKTGVELTSMGIPVVVAGEAWIRNKGITIDAGSSEEYFSILDGLPIDGRLDEGTLKRARTYAYHFFMRRMVPLEPLEETGAWPPFRLGVDAVSDLLPGRNPGLDVICDGILKGTPFVYPAERDTQLPDAQC